MQFKDSLSFIKSFLKDPKKIVATAMLSGSLIVGSQKISAQSLQFINPTELNPRIYKEGHVFSSRTYGFEADTSSLKFLEQAFEYRFGQKFNKNNQYNLALEVGKNNLYINGKLVPDLTFARIYSTIYLSKILNTSLDLRLGYSKEISNFVLKDIKLLDKTKFQTALSTKDIGAGASISIDKGKITGYDGLFDLKFEKEKYSAGLRYTENIKKSKYLSLQGFAKVKQENIIFIPSVQLGLEFKDGKQIPFTNYAIRYIPNQRLEVYIHRNLSNRNKQGLYFEINYFLGKTKKRKVLDISKKKEPKIIEKSKKEKIKTEKEQEIQKIEKQKRESFFKKLFLKYSKIKYEKPSKGYPVIKKQKRPKRPR